MRLIGTLALLIVFLVDPAGATAFAHTSSARSDSALTIPSDFSRRGALIRSTSDARYFLWQGIDEAELEIDEGLSSTLLASHRRQVLKHILTSDPYRLISRQRLVWANAQGSDPEQNRILKMYDMALKRRVGQVQRLSRIEALLVNEHLKLLNSTRTRNEFFAVILRRKRELRIYAGFMISDSEGMAPRLREVEHLILSDIKSGWQALAHLHNHPFSIPPISPGGDWGGALVPSAPDVYAWKSLSDRLGVQSLRLTNGFHTFVLKRRELSAYPPSLFKWPPKP